MLSSYSVTLLSCIAFSSVFPRSPSSYMSRDVNIYLFSSTNNKKKNIYLFSFIIFLLRLSPSFQSPLFIKFFINNTYDRIEISRTKRKICFKISTSHEYTYDRIEISHFRTRELWSRSCKHSSFHKRHFSIVSS